MPTCVARTRQLKTMSPQGQKRYRAIRRWCGSMSAVPRKRPNPGQVANEHFLWVMRPNVAQAIEDLGWAPRVSHLLYPDMALAELRATTSEHTLPAS